MNRRAGLQMSVQSIIVFILAFIVMGALIGVVTTIMNQVNQGVSRLPPTQVTVQPTPDQPVLIEGGKFAISSRKTQEVVFSFYNKGKTLSQGPDGNTCPDGTICGWGGLAFQISSCQGFAGAITDATELPKIQATYAPTTLSETIDNGAVVVLRTYIKEQGMPAGKYTCRLKVYAIKNPEATNVLADSNKLDGYAGGGTNHDPLAQSDFTAEIN